MIDSYYLDSQIRDGFTYDKTCYTHSDNNNTHETRPQCTHTHTHTHAHISQQLNSLADTAQRHQVYTSKVDASLFTSDTTTPCEFNIVQEITEIEMDNPTEVIYKHRNH